MVATQTYKNENMRVLKPQLKGHRYSQDVGSKEERKFDVSLLQVGCKILCREHRRRTNLELSVASKFKVPTGSQEDIAKWIMGNRTTGECGILPGDLELASKKGSL